MKGFFGNITIDIPTLSEQLAVVKEFERFERLANKLKIIHMSIDKLFTRVIV